MTLLQMTYLSRPFGFDAGVLTAILFDARRCNGRDGVTGALICRDDLFLQLLEGPADKVEATYARIRADDRHVEVTPLTRRGIAASARMFPEWSMRDDPAQSYVWDRQSVANGAPGRASEAEVLAIFTALAQAPEGP